MFIKRSVFLIFLSRWDICSRGKWWLNGSYIGKNSPVICLRQNLKLYWRILHLLGRQNLIQVNMNSLGVHKNLPDEERVVVCEMRYSQLPSKTQETVSFESWIYFFDSCLPPYNFSIWSCLQVLKSIFNSYFLNERIENW